MKRRMLKTIGLLILLMLCTILTGCYKERDPWPASADFQTEETAAPPTAIPTAAVTAEPVATAAPTPETKEVQDFWADEPTRVPGGSAEPGTNG